MLKNYYEVDENSTVQSFLKEVNDKKNMQYIILDTHPKSFVDIRSIALRVHNLNEKLKNLKKPLSFAKGKNRDDYFNFLVESGERVIGIDQDKYYDFLDALEDIKNHDFEFLSQKVESLNTRKEIFALNEDDKISQARNLFLKKRINLLPVIENNGSLIGEVRTYDLLVNSLFETNKDKADYYDENYKNPTLNLPISNILNPKPLTLDVNSTFKQVLDLMLSKKVPSIIITSDEKLYSIISYKDLFKLVKKDDLEGKYRIEYVGADELYDDEFDLICDFANRTMRKIAKISDYDTLKLSFKLHGNKEGTHQKKLSVNLNLSKGNHIIHVDKEIVSGTNTDELINDKVKGKWNIPQTVQEALNILEKKVKTEKNKK